MRALLLVLAACNSSSSPPPVPASGSAAAPEAKSELKVSIDGRPIGMAKAYIKDLPAGAWQLYVSSVEATCQELLTNVFTEPKGAQTLLLNIGHRLAPDGTVAMVVTEVFIRGTGEVAPARSSRPIAARRRSRRRRRPRR